MFVVLKSVQRWIAPKTERNGFGQVNFVSSRPNPITRKFPLLAFWSPKQRTSIGINLANSRER